MKTKIRITLSSFAIVFFSNYAQAQITTKQKYALIEKALPTTRTYNTTKKSFENVASISVSDAIDPEWTILDTSVARRNVENSQDIFHLNGKAMPLLADELKHSDLTAIANATAATGCTSCTNSIGAVRIHYALNNSTLTLYYEAISVCPTTKTIATSANKVLREYTYCASGSFFMHSAGQFVLMNAAQVTQKDLDVYAFQHHTKFHLNSSGSYDNFNLTGDNDGTGDVRSVIYPLDELFFLCPSSTSKILLWNAVEKTKVAAQSYTKNSLVISTSSVEVNGSKLRIPSTERFADLAHICPVNCNTFSFHD